MKAILRTWDTQKETYEDEEVEIDDNHDFSQGPYADTVPFAVGSNQEILEHAHRRIVSELSEGKATNGQMLTNIKWLIGKFDTLHRIFCEDQSGTWQQRVEQVVDKLSNMKRVS